MTGGELVRKPKEEWNAHLDASPHGQLPVASSTDQTPSHDIDWFELNRQLSGGT